MNHFKLFVLDLFTALFPNQMSIKNLDSEWAWVVSYMPCATLLEKIGAHLQVIVGFIIQDSLVMNWEITRSSQRLLVSWASCCHQFTKPYWTSSFVLQLVGLMTQFCRSPDLDQTFCGCEKKVMKPILLIKKKLSVIRTPTTKSFIYPFASMENSM